jgi:hypothetical protein
VFRIDHCCDPAEFLSLRDRVDRQGRFSACLRSVDFHDSASRIAPDSKRVIQRDGTAGNDLNVPLWLIPQLHDRPFPIIFLNLVDRGLQCLQFGCVSLVRHLFNCFSHNVL